MSIFDEINAMSKVDRTWEKWKEYREEVTKLLLKECADMNRIVIVGAGNCDDIDLQLLAQNVAEIILLDNDAGALHSATKRLEKTGKMAKIRGQIMGIDGMQTYMYREFCDRLVSYIRSSAGLSLSAFDAYACSLLMEYDQAAIKNRNETENSWKQADAYICLGVCSQLQTMPAYVYHTFRDYLLHLPGLNTGDESRKGVMRFEALLRQRNEQTIGWFHDMMLISSRKKLIVGNEYQRSLKRDTLRERAYEEVLDVGIPIEGAYQAIMDVRNRNLTCREYTAYWPFDVSSGIGYEMVIQVITK